MATLMADLVVDLIEESKKLTRAREAVKLASTRLSDSLVAGGTPLSVGGSVVVGAILLTRPYDSLPIEWKEIANVSPDTVVSE